MFLRIRPGRGLVHVGGGVHGSRDVWCGEQDYDVLVRGDA